MTAHLEISWTNFGAISVAIFFLGAMGGGIGWWDILCAITKYGGHTTLLVLGVFAAFMAALKHLWVWKLIPQTPPKEHHARNSKNNDSREPTELFLPGVPSSPPMGYPNEVVIGQGSSPPLPLLSWLWTLPHPNATRNLSKCALVFSGLVGKTSSHPLPLAFLKAQGEEGEVSDKTVQSVEVGSPPSAPREKVSVVGRTESPHITSHGVGGGSDLADTPPGQGSIDPPQSCHPLADDTPKWTIVGVTNHPESQQTPETHTKKHTYTVTPTPVGGVGGDPQQLSPQIPRPTKGVAALGGFLWTVDCLQRQLVGGKFRVHDSRKIQRPCQFEIPAPPG